MKPETKESLLIIICIVIFLGLTVKLTLEASKYDCDMCTVSLSNMQGLTSDFHKVYEENITKLIEAYKDGDCLYGWDPNQGYIKT